MKVGYALYYSSISKPFFAPPPWVFGVAWAIIYPLIACAGVILIILVYKKQVPRSLLWVYLLNLGANVAFTPLQLWVGSTLLATLALCIVVGTVVYIELRVWKYSKLIFWLLVPYLLWGLFATMLQFSIVALN